MAEYIEREALYKDVSSIEVVTYNGGNEDFDNGVMFVLEKLDSIPTADVVEVRHAQFKWGYQNGQYGIWCTDCGAGWVDSENAEWIAHEHDYCPHCGAKMDGKGE